MAKETKNFVLRIDSQTMEAIEKWAEDEFRSVNGQILYILSEALKKNKRLPKPKKTLSTNNPDTDWPFFHHTTSCEENPNAEQARFLLYFLYGDLLFFWSKREFVASNSVLWGEMAILSLNDLLIN